MGVEDLLWVEVRSRAAWRDWLAANHTQRAGIWLVTFKKHRADLHLPWPDLVRECLCFGWIDSRSKRVDDDRTRVMVTPRKPGSVWSAVNQRLVEELEASGLLAPAGRAVIERARADGSWSALDDVEALRVPDDLGEALRASGGAEAWQALPASRRKQLLLGLHTAKRPATRAARVAEAVAAVSPSR